MSTSDPSDLLSALAGGRGFDGYWAEKLLYLTVHNIGAKDQVFRDHCRADT